ncbi:AMP-binding protein [Nostoc sp.]|uniref:AMP-binding protein n=1 Tax=Nostoc sp. TaxID=1180 RepID=UPI002FFCBF74
MIFRSTEPNISIPEQLLTEIVLQRVKEFPDKPAMIDGLTGGTITYGELADSVSKVAAGFAARGFSKGDVVAIYSPNCLEYPIAFQAIASLGGVSSTANPSYTASELAYQLNDAAVIPSPHPSTGEVPKGFVVLKSEATTGEIMEFVAGLVAPHKRIRRLEIVDKIPKSAYGKILRRLLVQREIANIGENPPEPQLTKNLQLLQQLTSTDETKRQELLVNYIREKVVKVLGLDESQHLNLQKPLNEMGLNSLSNIDLKNRIDTEIGVNLPIEILLAGSNIHQLVNLLLEELTSKRFVAVFWMRNDEHRTFKKHNRSYKISHGSQDGTDALVSDTTYYFRKRYFRRR